MSSANLCSLAGRYDNPIPTRFLAPIDCLKIPAQHVSSCPVIPSLYVTINGGFLGIFFIFFVLYLCQSFFTSVQHFFYIQHLLYSPSAQHLFFICYSMYSPLSNLYSAFYFPLSSMYSIYSASVIACIPSLNCPACIPLLSGMNSVPHL
jgi:hypothetical protein